MPLGSNNKAFIATPHHTNRAMTRVNLDKFLTYGQAADFVNKVGSFYATGDNDALFVISTRRQNDWYTLNWTAQAVRDFLGGKWSGEVTGPYLQLGGPSGTAVTIGRTTWSSPPSFLETGDSAESFKAIMVDASPLGVAIQSQADSQLSNMYTGANSSRVAFVKMSNGKPKGKSFGWKNDAAGAGPQMALFIDKHISLSEQTEDERGTAEATNQNQVGNSISTSAVIVGGGSSSTFFKFQYAAKNSLKFTAQSSVVSTLTTTNEQVNETSKTQGFENTLKFGYQPGNNNAGYFVNNEMKGFVNTTEKYSFKNARTETSTETKTLSLEFNLANLKDGIFNVPGGKPFQMEDGKSYLLTFAYKQGTLRGNVENKALFAGTPGALKLNSAFYAAGKDDFNGWNLTAPVGTLLDLSEKFGGNVAYDTAPGQLVKVSNERIVANNFALSEFKGADSEVEILFREVLPDETPGGTVRLRESTARTAYVDDDATNDEIIVEGADAFVSAGGGSDDILVKGLNGLVYAGTDDDTVRATGENNSVWLEEGDDQIDCGDNVKVNTGLGADTIRINGSGNTAYIDDLDISEDVIELNGVARNNYLLGFNLTEDRLVKASSFKISANLAAKTVEISDGVTGENVAEVILDLESLGTPGMQNPLDVLVCINADRLPKDDVVNYFQNPSSNEARDAVVALLLTGSGLTSTEEFAELALQESNPVQWAIDQIFNRLPQELGGLTVEEREQVKATILAAAPIYFTPDAFAGGDPGQVDTEDFNFALGEITGLLVPSLLNGPFRPISGDSPSDEGDAELTVIGQNLFTIATRDGGEVILQISPSASASTAVNDLAVFAVDDAQGRIDGLNQDDAGYAQAALSRARNALSFLADRPDGFDPANLRSSLLSENGESFRFLLIQNDSLDAVRQRNDANPAVLFGSPDQLTIAATGRGTYTLTWAEDPGRGDAAEGIVFEVEARDSQAPLGTTVQGQPEAELIDLREFASDTIVEASFEVYREAAFDNYVGFFAIQDLQGTIADSVTGKLVRPGDAGYLEMAVRNRIAGLDLRVANRATTTVDVSLQGGGLLAPFLVVDGAPEWLDDDSTGNDPVVYVPFLAANADRVDHVRLLGDNTIGFEDLAGGGDLDCNDIIVKAILSVA